MSRTNKQLIYGIFYFVIFSLVIWWLFGGFLNNNKKNNEESLNVLPLKVVGLPQFLPFGNNQGVVLVKVSNLNSDYAAFEFFYVFKVYNASGLLITSVQGSDFLYAAETNKYIFEVLKDVAVNEIERVDFEISQVNWKPKDEFSKPAVGVTSVSTAVLEKAVQVEGAVINNTHFLLNEVRVTAVIFDSFGYELAISRTIVNKLEPLTRQSFVVFIPIDSQLIKEKVDLQKTLVFVSAR